MSAGPEWETLFARLNRIEAKIDELIGAKAKDADAKRISVQARPGDVLIQTTMQYGRMTRIAMTVLETRPDRLVMKSVDGIWQEFMHAQVDVPPVEVTYELMRRVE